MASKYTKDILQQAVASATCFADVLRNLGLQTTGGNHRSIKRLISYHGIETTHLEKKKVKLTKAQVQKHVGDVKSLAGLLRALGEKPTGASYSALKSIIEDNEIDISHFTGKTWSKGLNKKTDARVKKQADTLKAPDEEVFCENSPFSTKYVRKRLLEDHGREYKCSNVECGLSEWMGKPITLHLDHINGINNDNRFQNLRFLCPNCHQQTDTWGRTAKAA